MPLLILPHLSLPATGCAHSPAPCGCVGARRSLHAPRLPAAACRQWCYVPWPRQRRRGPVVGGARWHAHAPHNFSMECIFPALCFAASALSCQHLVPAHFISCAPPDVAAAAAVGVKMQQLKAALTSCLHPSQHSGQASQASTLARPAQPSVGPAQCTTSPSPTCSQRLCGESKVFPFGGRVRAARERLIGA